MDSNTDLHQELLDDRERRFNDRHSPVSAIDRPYIPDIEIFITGDVLTDSVIDRPHTLSVPASIHLWHGSPRKAVIFNSEQYEPVKIEISPIALRSENKISITANASICDPSGDTLKKLGGKHVREICAVAIVPEFLGDKSKESDWLIMPSAIVEVLPNPKMLDNENP